MRRRRLALRTSGSRRSRGRHRPDDRLGALEVAPVDRFLGLLGHAAHARDHPHDLADRAHLLDLLELLEHVLEGEAAPCGASRSQPSRPASASNASWARSTRVRTSPMPRIRPARRSGWKGSRASRLLAGAQELDRQAGHGADREGRAAAGVAVDLGEDEAGDRHGGGEGLGHADGLLADHRVDHEERLDGLDRAVPARRDLGHQRLVDGQPAGGVEDHRVADLAAGGARAPPRRSRRPGSRRAPR